jgi:hypothetical protein
MNTTTEAARLAAAIQAHRRKWRPDQNADAIALTLLDVLPDEALENVRACITRHVFATGMRRNDSLERIRR